MTKDEITEELKGIRNSFFMAISNVMDKVAQLPDTAPQPEPGPSVERNYVLLGVPADGKPEITVDIPSNPVRPYFALTHMIQNGPDNNIAIKIMDRDGNRLDGIPILVGVEDTDLAWDMASGEKNESEYDRKRFWVRIGEGASDVVRNASTHRWMPDDQFLDMVDGHIRLELTFTRYD